MTNDYKSAIVWVAMTLFYATSIGAYGPDTPSWARILSCILLFATARYLVYPKGELKTLKARSR